MWIVWGYDDLSTENEELHVLHVWNEDGDSGELGMVHGISGKFILYKSCIGLANHITYPSN